MPADIVQQQIEILLAKLSQSQTNSSIAEAETQLITLVISLPKKKLSSTMNTLIEKMTDWNFQHVFEYLINDEEFLTDYQNQLIEWIAENLTITTNGLSQFSKSKQLLMMDLLLNTSIPSTETKTLANLMIESKCRTDLNLCYSLLWNVNQTLAESSIEELNKYDFNELTILSIRVIKGFTKLPSHLIDEALKFVSVILLPKTLSQGERVSEEMKEITQILLQKVIQILSTQKSTIGNTYRFVGSILYYYEKLGLCMQNPDFTKIFTLCANNILKVFPNLTQLKPNALESQIQKLHQYFSQKDPSKEEFQIEKRKIEQMNIDAQIDMNNRLELLRGYSFYLNQFFSFFVSEKHQDIGKQVLITLSDEFMNINHKACLLLSYCNDREIFCNFIETYYRRQKIKNICGVEFNFENDHLMKQIIENCPNSVGLESVNSHTFKRAFETLLNHVVCCLEDKVRNMILEGNLSQFLEMIRQNIQKQYDHAFSIVQFESACNALTLIFKITNEYSKSSMEEEIQQKTSQVKRTLSKDDIIEWIKMLINLNESCLPKQRKLIVSKTYELLAEVFEIVLPGNQYLQEVVQEELLTKSFPSQKQVLNRLIKFYENRSAQIFQLGYTNQSEFNRISSEFNQLFTKNLSSVDSEKKGKIISETTFTNTVLRKYKLLERVYKKLEDHQLSLKGRKYLWNIAVRIYKLGSQNDGLNVKNVVKLFSARPEILFARHLAAVQSQDLEIKDHLSLTIRQLQEIQKEFRKNPVFYQEELRIQKDPTQA